MIAGGGTGGHIYPAIAIAREYVARDKSRRVIFVGTERGLEKTIVPKAGFTIEFISVGGLKGKGGTDLLRNLLQLPVSLVQASKILGKYQPNAVLGVGGYFMMWYSAVHAYPFNIGGRPLNSWPSFIIVTFEMTILFSGLSAVFGMLA